MKTKDEIKIRKLENYDIRFETNLNASMILTVKARSYEDARKKVLLQFPDAFNFD